MGLRVVDAYYKQGHMFMVSDTCEFMCCGCMVLAKSMLEDPCLMGSCYQVDVRAIGFCYYIIKYHGFHLLLLDVVMVNFVLLVMCWECWYLLILIAFHIGQCGATQKYFCVYGTFVKLG